MRIIKGKMPSAKKVVIYGPEGIGKSTFASQFPDPVFIDTEGSTKDMDVARFEKASSWQMLTDQIRYVRSTPGVCKTLVIDTADWAEQMCVEDLCARNGKKGIEDFGYGNGYVYAKEEFGRFLNLLSEVVDAGINVVITAHSQIRKFEQPDELGAYDRYELKLGKKTQSQTSPLLKEWADMVLFANYKTLAVSVDDKGKKHKAQGGRRVMYTSHHPCWDAKNRYGLPEELPFTYDAIRSIIEGDGQQPVQEKAEVKPDPAAPEMLQRQQATVSAPEPAATTAPVRPTPPPAESPRQPSASSGGSGAADIPSGTPQRTDPGRADPPEQQQKSVFEPDKRVPKNLRDLMIENVVMEDEVQRVCEARGYVPLGTPLWEYDRVNPGIVDGLLVASWQQVYAAIRDARAKQEIPFD